MFLLSFLPMHLTDFSKLLTRFSQFRTKFKVAAASKVGAYYKVGPGFPGTSQCVKNLLADKKYVFPGDIAVSILSLSEISVTYFPTDQSSDRSAL
jgi:hypothetical protein